MNTLILTFITTLSLLMGALNGTNTQKNIALNAAKKALIEIQSYQKQGTLLGGQLLGVASTTPFLSINRKSSTSTAPSISDVSIYSLEPGYFGFDSNPQIIDNNGKKSVIYTIKSPTARIEITLDNETKQSTSGMVRFDDKSSGTYTYIVKIVKDNFYSVIKGTIDIP
jgi:hypothetical protein